MSRFAINYNPYTNSAIPPRGGAGTASPVNMAMKTLEGPGAGGQSQGMGQPGGQFGSMRGLEVAGGVDFGRSAKTPGVGGLEGVSNPFLDKTGPMAMGNTKPGQFAELTPVNQGGKGFQTQFAGLCASQMDQMC